MKRRGRLSGGNPNQLPIDWHPAEVEAKVILPTEHEPAAGKPPATTDDEPPDKKRPHRHRDAVVARLPVPRPLPASVAAGRFGHDEQGKVIRPAADEIRAITINQADKLIDMLDAMTDAAGNSAELSRLGDSFRSLITAYAQDFGERAGLQLEAFARRQASRDESSRDDYGWHR